MADLVQHGLDLIDWAIPSSKIHLSCSHVEFGKFRKKKNKSRNWLIANKRQYQAPVPSRNVDLSMSLGG